LVTQQLFELQGVKRKEAKKEEELTLEEGILHAIKKRIKELKKLTIWLGF